MKDPKAKPAYRSKLGRLLKFDQQLIAAENVLVQGELQGIIGVDEVGRGSLVGPVTAAAVFIPAHLHRPLPKALKYLDDSKAPHLNHEKRVQMAAFIRQHCYWGLGEASHEEIETINIYYASLLASQRALDHLVSKHPECQSAHHLVIIDGKAKIPTCTHPHKAVIKADGLSASVAAAAVLAKSHRDCYLIELAQMYPGYGWETNAGYATPAHKKALKELGLTPLHRKTFQAVREATEFQRSLLQV